MEKPPYATVEFWLQLAAIVMVNIGAEYADEPWARIVSIVGSALVALGYGAGLAARKKQSSAPRASAQGEQQ